MVAKEVLVHMKCTHVTCQRRERFAMRACLLGYPVGPWQLDADERRAYMDHGPTRFPRI